MLVLAEKRMNMQCFDWSGLRSSYIVGQNESVTRGQKRILLGGVRERSWNETLYLVCVINTIAQPRQAQNTVFKIGINIQPSFQEPDL